MSCGKKPLVKNWDHPRNIAVIKPSRYQKNEASVKEHWKKVLRDLEMSTQDENFWDANIDFVREIVGQKLFARIAKIFKLPATDQKYELKPDISSSNPSEKFYAKDHDTEILVSAPENVTSKTHRAAYSNMDFQSSADEENDEEQTEDETTEISSFEHKMLAKSKSAIRSKTIMTKTLERSRSKSFSKIYSKTALQSFSSKASKFESDDVSADLAYSGDDMEVHVDEEVKPSKKIKNPFYEMLYCNESVTDMIKWKSKHFKMKEFQVSASDEFSKRAEILTKKIAKDFFEWWTNLGSVDFKSEIKRAEDIENLFQVWFDEHASRGLVVDPKILPCVLDEIAHYVGMSDSSCRKVLNRQIVWDIIAETSPAHTKAFNLALPNKRKHIPPRNNTKEQWKPVYIPEDLRSMSCVWGDILHLTSTKSFQKWLKARPNLSIPICLRDLEKPGEQKPQFVVPSDMVLRDSGSEPSTHDLSLPISQFSVQLKEVLSKLMNE